MKIIALLLVTMLGCAADDALDPPPTPTCMESYDLCLGNDICIDGTCVPAFTRDYDYVNIRVLAPETNPSTLQPWDVGSDPDIYIGDEFGKKLTPVASDGLSAVFAGPIAVNVTGALLRLDLWDDDVAVADHMMWCESRPVEVALLRARQFACEGAGFLLSADIFPHETP